MELRDALKKMRGELGVNQAELAGALHVSFASVSRWESGKTRPNRSALGALMEYAGDQRLSTECMDSLRVSVKAAKRSKIAPNRDGLFSVEHASLSQLIDDASFSIYVCDLETDELLYMNHRAEERMGGPLKRPGHEKCYKCIMHRDSPCPFCHKDLLVSDRFTTFKVFRPDENIRHLVQGKLIRWNGRKAQVRYVIDISGTI